MCAGKEFQVEGADTEKARREKLLVTPAELRPNLINRFVLEERKDLWKIVRDEFRRVERLRGMKCFPGFLGLLSAAHVSVAT